MFEGVIVDVLTKIIVYCVQSGYFSLADVNEKIKSFPYSRSDKKDEPQPFTISSLTNFKIKLTAIESWNFLRLFPLMFGECIPRTDIYWKLLGDLLDCVELFTAIKYDEGLTYYMEEKYATFVEAFVNLFPDVNVKPKMHYGIHYGSQTRDAGPARTRFTLRFESKNHVIKQPIIHSKNRVNVCKTLANRHQFRMYLTYKNDDFFFCKAT